ncbi:MAG: hypothetical protein R6U50_15965 [Desulfobacterales bacterium]
MNYKYVYICENCGKEKEMEISYTLTPLGGKSDIDVAVNFTIHMNPLGESGKQVAGKIFGTEADIWLDV